MSSFTDLGSRCWVMQCRWIFTVTIDSLCSIRGIKFIVLTFQADQPSASVILTKSCATLTAAVFNSMFDRVASAKHVVSHLSDVHTTDDIYHHLPQLILVEAFGRQTVPRIAPPQRHCAPAAPVMDYGLSLMPLTRSGWGVSESNGPRGSLHRINGLNVLLLFRSWGV